MRKSISLILAVILLLTVQGNVLSEDTPTMNVGSDHFLSKYHHLIEGKNISVVTNQTGVNPGDSPILKVLSEYPEASLKAVYTTGQGTNGQSDTHPILNIPVYSLDGEAKIPTQEMLQEVDVWLFDIQDIGARTYSYISTLNYFMIAAKQNSQSVIVLDRPNRLNGEIAAVPYLKGSYRSLVGADILQVAHGMTIGELAQYFNREMGVDLTVIPMDPYMKKVRLEGGLSTGNKSYLPLKPVLQEFGYEIGWDAVTKEVYAERPGKMIVIQTAMSPMKVWVNGTEIMSKHIDPMLKAGTTYIPAQFIPWLEKSQQQTVGNQIHIDSADLSIVVGITVKAPAKQPGKIAYLTFDDGPSVITPQILDILKENGVKATFFVIGRNIKGYESVLKRAVAEGHTIAGHSYSHNYDVIYHDVDAFFKDLEKGQIAIEQVTGKKTSVFRFPGGSNNSVSKNAQDPKVYGKNKWIMKDLVKEAENRGYHYYDWNVSTGDAAAQGYTPESAIKKVGEGIKAKKDVVILSHDSAPKINTVKALPKIIELLKNEGYSFGTLDEAVEGFTFLR